MNLIGAHHHYTSSLPSIQHKSLTNAGSDYFVTVSDQQSSTT